MKIKISKASLKDHFRYYIWAYVGVVLITGMLLNLVVTAINSQAPPDKTLLCMCAERLSRRPHTISSVRIWKRPSAIWS